MEKCSDCKSFFRNNEKGCKMKPKPLCPKCVTDNKLITCVNLSCKKTAKWKDGWWDDCWICHNPVCNNCVSKKVNVKGLDFSFCEEHPKPNIKELKEDAQGLIDEEKSWEEDKH
ncbi:hypothetical protein LCGC14_0861160 [marine sediment metagenome]|uniref:Uncharacterized protein n=1 Tax=marine sediment metagenome TaxID=412755 RepID=A0A0F9RS33_9ZZZZ